MLYKLLHFFFLILLFDSNSVGWTCFPAPLSVCNALINVPKDSDAYAMKRKEAIQKYEM